MKRVDGWFKVYGWMVFVEGGVIVRGYSCTGKGGTLYPYKTTREGWDRADMSLTTFRARAKRGLAEMK